jgi:hypothetical protein
MKLSDEKSRRLTALVWRERARRFVPLLLAVVALFAGLTFFFIEQTSRADRTVDVQAHAGTVTGIQRAGSVRSSGVVHVHLEDGRDVDAMSAPRMPLAVGAHVVINEARHVSGRVTYDVVRAGD